MDESDKPFLLSKEFGDPLEEAYISYIERSGGQKGGGGGMEQITLSGKELMDHVFIDDFNGNKMKVKTHEIIQTAGDKPTQQLSLLLYQQASSGQHVLFLFAVYNGEYEGIQGDGE